MGKRRERQELWAKVESFEWALKLAHETVVDFGRAVIDDPESSESVDLYNRGRSQTKDIAQGIESLPRNFHPTSFLGEQVVALSLMITAMKYSVVAQGSDEEFLVSVLVASDDLYRHNLLVLQAMRQSEARAVEVFAQLRAENHDGSRVDINQLCNAVAEVASGLPSIY